MASTPTQIRDKIIVALNTIKGSGKVLQEVFDYIEPSPEEYPSAMVTIGNLNENVFMTSDENMATYRYIIHIEIRDGNDKTTEDKVLEIIEDVKTLFATEPYVNDLDDVVQIAKIEGIQSWKEDQSDNPKRGIDVVLSCSQLENTA